MLGPSGSGKSTLTLCLDGLIPHVVEGDYSGSVAVAGLVTKDSPVHLLAQEAGLVFQDPDAQFCTLTVEDEIAFGLENLRRSPEEIEAAIDKSLVSVRLAGYRERMLSELSGGEKQRVALAAVLAMGPRVLVLDEPSANLDPQATSELFGLLRQLARDGRHTIVIIEHKLDEIIDWVGSVLALTSGGRVLYRGDPRTAFYEQGVALSAAGVWRPQTVELVNALRETGWGVPGSPLSVDETVAALVATPGLGERMGRAVAVPAGSITQAEALISATGLSYRYPGSPAGRSALSDVSFAVRRGAFLAIVGANGAGKSTLASLLTGVLEPPPGTVRLEGNDLTAMSAAALSERVGHVFQNPEHQFVSDTVLGELAFSLCPKAGRKGARHLTAEQRDRADAWLERLGLLPLAEANPFTLSHGQKRRLSVAAMLIRGQSLLLLDEPTLGQDEEQAARLMAMMQAFRAGGGTVAMITHDMRLVAEYADSLLVLAEGRALYSGRSGRLLLTTRSCGRGRSGGPGPGARGCGAAPTGWSTRRPSHHRGSHPGGRQRPRPGGRRACPSGGRPVSARAAAGCRGYLGRRNPCMKLLAVALAALALTFIFDPLTPAVIFVLTLLAGCVLGGLSLSTQLKPLWIFLVAGVAILLANILFNKQNAAAEVLVHLGSLKITGPALWAAGTLWFRLLAFALLSLVFIKTTEPQRLIISLVHQLHLNYRVAFGTMVGYRMLPLLQNDYLTIRAAQRVRGVREARGILHPWTRSRRYALPLLTGAIRKAGRVAMAMDARAFGALPGRTYRERMVVGRADWLFLATVIVVVAGVVLGTWGAGIARFTVG